MSDYRVLRGGSWATSRRVATATFRNWDLPQRRQIFAGVRLARDALMEPVTGADRADPHRLASRRRRRNDRSPRTCSTA